MLFWSAIFFVVALISATLGFGGIAGTTATFFKVASLCFFFAFVVTLLMGVFRRAA